MATYDLGQRVTVLVTFQSSSGAYIDPTDVEVKIERPRGLGTVRSTNPTKLSVGKYTMAHTTTTYGRFTYVGIGTGAFIGAAEGAFAVRPRQTT